MILRAAELFAGAGGLGLGAKRAGIDVVVAVEADADAARTYSRNHRRAAVVSESIDARWSLSDVLEKQGIGRVDLVLGGPPCQGWSTLGARSQDAHREILNECVSVFLDKVLEVRPLAFVMENVRGLKSAEQGRRLDRLLEGVGAHYELSCEVLKAADYGVPQLRHRLFVVGIRKDLGVAFEFPEVSVQRDQYTTVDDAIGDLPQLAGGECASEYCRSPVTPYQRRLRGSCEVLRWHEAPDHPDSLVELLKKIEPGKARSDLPESERPRSGFHNTYGRMEWGMPAPAVTAAIGRVSSGRHAHPRDHRALTPREAARLQGFPDSYRWVGQRWHVYRMIGNAVPPDLAEAVLSALVGTLRAADVETPESAGIPHGRL